MMSQGMKLFLMTDVKTDAPAGGPGDTADSWWGLESTHVCLLLGKQLKQVPCLLTQMSPKTGGLCSHLCDGFEGGLSLAPQQWKT